MLYWKVKIISQTIGLILLLFFISLGGFINKVEAIDIAPEILEVFKQKHPEISASQLQIYSEILAKGDIELCNGQLNHDSCVLAVSYLSQIYTFCGEIDDTTLQLQCVAEIFANNFDAFLTNCSILKENKNISECQLNLFQLFKNSKDCQFLSTESAESLCLDVINFNQAMANQDNVLCQQLNSIDLKKYCLDTILNNAKYKDTDKDGIPDDLEIIAGTDPLKTDSNGNGVSDLEELKMKGSIPSVNINNQVAGQAQININNQPIQSKPVSASDNIQKVSNFLVINWISILLLVIAVALGIVGYLIFRKKKVYKF